MVFEAYRADAMRCTRCSYCKWIPFDRMKSYQFAKGCPSVDYSNFHSYSAGGRLVTMLSVMDGRSDIDDRVIDIAYKCTLCGQCDVSCKVCRYDMWCLDDLRGFRKTLNELGYVPPAYPGIISVLRNTGNMEGRPQASRAAWADGLGLKVLGRDGAKTADVLFHAGCSYSFDPALRSRVRAAARVLQKAGLDFAVASAERCCGQKAHDMGYRHDFAREAERTVDGWTAAGVKTVVTPCASCYYAFKRLYPELGSAVEVLHTVEVADRLLEAGALTPTMPVPLRVTYHDPCLLGRQGEPYEAWAGREVKIYGQGVVYDPPRPRYIGAQGVYAAPRRVLQALPGLDLVEMERTREAGFCCGGGGVVPEAYPDFSAWTAAKRLEEAKSTGAEAIVTACPRCERNLMAAAGQDGGTMEIFDVFELVERAL